MSSGNAGWRGLSNIPCLRLPWEEWERVPEVCKPSASEVKMFLE